MKETRNLEFKEKISDSFLKTVVANWMRNYNTIEYLGIWELLNNPKFNPL